MGKTVKQGRAHRHETIPAQQSDMGRFEQEGPFIVDFLVFTWRLCSTHEAGVHRKTRGA